MSARGADAWKRYATRGYRRVPGWLEPPAIGIFTTVMRHQAQVGITGPVCEIGSHLGRTLILLHLLSSPGELAAGFDRYELQDEANGRERKRRLLAYAALHGGDTARIRLHNCDSTGLRAQELVALCGRRPRLVSIDAGRTAEAVYSDLRLAHDVVVAGGVVSITDFFREAWPEVSEGCCRFMHEGGGLVPFALGGNKLFFTTHTEHAAALQRELSTLTDARTTRMFGRPVTWLPPSTLRRRLARTWLWRAFRGTSLADSLRTALTRGR
jgi:methyltransferase family protein